ncbi:MAG TPA: hybrid sensor histidine kinase/response regulator [Prolixibacteraceae bacterium]
MGTDELLSQNRANILIVDDVPANLKVLGEILKGEGYLVRPVPNGVLALKVAERTEPDLILLDIMMPDLNGFEVCKLLKENKKVCDIPVIFISALNDTQDIVKALRSGGVDFISKPFQAEEVIARVKTHLQLRYQSKKLVEQSKELQKLIATKDKFFSIIAHDLRGPLGGFMGITELLVEDLSPDEKNELTIELNHSAKALYNLLENLLEWARMQQGQTSFNPGKINLNGLVHECLNAQIDSIRKKEINVDIAISESHEVFADANLLQSIVRNLLSNAVKFTPRNGTIAVSTYLTHHNSTVVIIKDSGIGMKSEMASNLFQLNVNNSRPGTEGERSSGLGLQLCKEFVEKHGGEIWVESEVNVGTSFYFSIPVLGT